MRARRSARTKSSTRCRRTRRRAAPRPPGAARARPSGACATGSPSGCRPSVPLLLLGRSSLGTFTRATVFRWLLRVNPDFVANLVSVLSVTATERPTSAQPALLKDLNERAVLDAIRAGAPISRAEISRRARISKPTVSVALQSLLHAGLVREAAEGREGRSYGAVFFEPVPEAALVFGVDIGARFLRGALCDLRGEVRARQDVEVDGADAGLVLDAVVRLRDGLVSVSGLPADRIDSVVAGVPGVVENADGRIRL